MAKNSNLIFLNEKFTFQKHTGLAVIQYIFCARDNMIGLESKIHLPRQSGHLIPSLI